MESEKLMNTLPNAYESNFDDGQLDEDHFDGDIHDDASVGETSVAVVEEPAGPTGPDFTKPLRTVVGRYPVRVLTTGASNPGFPVVALVKIDGVETAINYNTMGEDAELARVIENVPPIPPVAIGRVLRSIADDGLIFDSRVFANEVDARDTPADGFEFISTYRVLLPQVNALGEQEEIEESEDAPGPQELRVNGRLLKVGDTLSVQRRGFGYRNARVVKFRLEPSHKQVFVQAEDGSNPYWALNKNVR